MNREIAQTIDNFFITYKELSMGSSEIRKLQSSDEIVSIWNYNEISLSKEKHKYLIIIPFEKAQSVLKKTINNIDAIEFSLTEKIFLVKMEYSKIFFVDIFNQITSNNSENIRTSKELEEVISFVSPNGLYNELFDFSGYEEYLLDNLEFRKVNKFYIDRTIKALVEYKDDLPTDKHLQTVLQNWAQMKGSKNILLIGDRGMGKSWAVMDFCLKRNIEHKNNRWIVPSALFIILANFNEDENKKSGMWKAIFRHVKVKYGIKLLLGDASLEALIKIGKIILVLDGYDDMNKFVNRETTYKQLFDLYSVVNESSKILLTSRMNYFDSMMQIFEHFAFTAFKQKKISAGFSEKSMAYTSEVINSDFNIWRLDNMDESERKQLSDKYKTATKESQGELILNSINLKKKKSFIENELYKLSSIPAFRFAIIKLLDDGKKSLIQVYRDSIVMAVIGYNINTDRSIEQYTERFGENFSERPLDLDRKWSSLEDLGWFIYEKQLYPIEKEKLKYFLLKNLESDFEEIFNDIKTQTVIKLAENEDSERYSFLTEELLSFFIASFLYKKISSNSFDFGQLGKYDLSKSNTGKNALKFLALLFQTEPNFIDKLQAEAIKTFEESKAYSFYTRFLIKNLEQIKINYRDAKNLDSWSVDPIKIEEGYVLIVSEKSKIPFKIKQYPITNNEFKEFLKSTYGERSRMNLDSQTEFEQFKIDYHLYLWRNDNIPKEESEKPLVYIGWFAAIDYCNWLSKKEKISPYYTFETNKNGDIIVNKDENSIGYRMPTEEEWLFVASEGRIKNEFPWEKYENTEQINTYKFELMNLSNDLRSILNFEQNDFGVFGMIGEVKEWVDNQESAIIAGNNRPIKGATLLTDYRLQKIIAIPGQNTNADVGFRVAKSVTKLEMISINKHK